jgi:hypothetical protein
MQRFTLGTLVIASFLILSEGSAFAQMGMPAMPGSGVAAPRQRRGPRRNRTPVLSPALNLVPGAVTSFEGQFLLRTIPQEQANRNTSQFSQQFQGLQKQMNQQESEIKSGIGKTGHSARFMNYGGYYSMGAGGSRR